MKPQRSYVLVDQWAFAVGTQLTRGKMKYRLGYSFNSNPINRSLGNRLGGIDETAAENVLLFQASSAPFINQHRSTGGVGCQGFIFPNVDLDLFAGGLFKASDQFGADTQHVGRDLLRGHGADLAVRRLLLPQVPVIIPRTRSGTSAAVCRGRSCAGS